VRSYKQEDDFGNLTKESFNLEAFDKGSSCNKNKNKNRAEIATYSNIFILSSVLLPVRFTGGTNFKINSTHSRTDFPGCCGYTAGCL
jgi:hypothetical protein